MHQFYSFAEWLKQLRLEQGLTQKQLAAMSSCSLSLLRKYESGLRRPTHATARKLAETLRLSHDETGSFLEAARTGKMGTPPSPVSSGDRPQRGWIPHPPTLLLGREQALKQVVEIILQAPGRLVTLIGPPGVGKSRLGIACGMALQYTFPDGVWFIDLASLEDPQYFIVTIARRLGIQLASPTIEEFIKVLQSQQLLLILDNFEHMLEAAPTIASLLRELGTLRVLATSRIPLRIRAEQIFPVEPLTLPQSARLGAIAAAPATALFCARAVAVAPLFRLQHQNAQKLVALCHKLDGLPLAIELVAAHCDQQSLDDLLVQLSSSLSQLDSRLMDMPRHQQTLMTTIAWSEQLLSEEERRSFMIVGVFVGSFAAETAYNVGATKLSALVEHGLLQQTTTGRYWMLETVRSFAAERLHTSTDCEQLRRNHAVAMAELSETLGNHLNTPEAALILERLQDELPNLRAAITWSLCHDAGLIALRITIAIESFWLSKGIAQEGRTLEGMLLAEPPPALPKDLLVKAYLLTGFLGSQQGDFKARVLLERGQALANELGLTEDIIRSLTLQAMVARYPGNLERCRVLLKEAITLARVSGNQLRLSGALNQLGMAYSENRQYQQALQCFEESTSIVKTYGSVTTIHKHQADVAETLYFLGYYEQSRSYLKQILQEVCEPHDLTAYWEAQLQLARIYMDSGDLERATIYLDSAAQAVEKMGLAYGYCKVRRQQGFLALLHHHDIAEAQSILNDAYLRSIRTFIIEEVVACLIGLAQSVFTRDSMYAARLCGAYEGCIGIFSPRVDQLTTLFHEQVRTRFTPDEKDIAGIADYIIQHSIRQVAFPDCYIAFDAIRLEHVIAQAIRSAKRE